MALDIWTKPSGYSLGVISERNQVNQTLPVENDSGVIYTIISGKLPPGLRIVENRIVGTPYEVARETEFTFCIRAKLDNQFSDRTFKVTIVGADEPTFITPGGNLDIGDYHQYFVMDKSYVDYQLEAIDYDTATGQRLSFFIADGDGELPPGLILTDDGRIVGFVQPVLSIKPEDGSGTYDEGNYDSVAYDFAVRPSNGFDSYIYDTVFYDYSTPTQVPKKLNRNYEFIVSVTDGDSVTRSQKYRIFVVGDDYFRADNTSWLDGSGLFTADVTYLRNPIWVTSSNLGTYRANNYATLIIDVYDTENIFYSLELVNANIIAKTKQKTLVDNLAGVDKLTIVNPTSIPTIGQWLTFNGRVTGATSALHQISNVATLGNGEYRLTLTVPLEVTLPDNIEFLIGTKSILPTGLEFDASNGEVFGRIPYQPAITKTYYFTITATKIGDKGDFARSSRMFSIQVIGEIDSVINWLTDSNLGTINANFDSLLKIEAETTITNSVLLYKVTSGRLPPGLSLNLDGEIVGKVNQYGNSDAAGLTTIDYQTSVTTFDNSATTIDRVYTFTAQVRDVLNYSAVSKTFNITIATPNELIFSNIKTKPFLSLSQRSIWHDFINNPSIFTPTSIYRLNDTSFGLQNDLSMIVYAGVETTEAAKYISAISLNHKRKRFHFGEVKTAVAIDPITRKDVYEVVYVEMIDPLEPNGKRLSNKIQFPKLSSKHISVDNSNIFWSRNIDDLEITAPDSPRPDPQLNVNSTGYLSSDSIPRTFFPNSISNWRERIKYWREDPANPNSAGFATERNYLPLWMRSIQPGTKQEKGFTLAVPLCYCKVGTAADIVLNIKYSEFDFKSLDYTVDRYIIDSVEGETRDKYLVFRNDRITV